MHVLVDALSVHFGGGQTFAIEQLTALRRARPDVDLHVLLAPWNESALTEPLHRVGAATEVVTVGSLARRWLWQEAALPSRAAAFDVLYAPGNLLPFRSVPVPTVVCQQNPNFTPEAEAMAHNQSPGRRLRIAQAYRSMRCATRTLVVAHWMLRSMATRVPELRTRAVVVHSGVPGWPDAAVPPPSIPEGASFHLVLSNDAPHKDLDLVVEAWGRLASIDPAAPDLVVAGDLGPDRIDEQRRLVPDAVRARLRHLGAVRERAQVRWLLERARSMVSASRLESCPLTVLEARSLACPLVLSATPSHEEAAADVARFFAVGDGAALASALAEAPARTPTPFSWTSWDEHGRGLGELLDDAAATAPPPP